MSSFYADTFHACTLEHKMGTLWQQKEKLLCLLYLPEQEHFKMRCSDNLTRPSTRNTIKYSMFTALSTQKRKKKSLTATITNSIMNYNNTQHILITCIMLSRFNLQYSMFTILHLLMEYMQLVVHFVKTVHSAVNWWKWREPLEQMHLFVNSMLAFAAYIQRLNTEHM